MKKKPLIIALVSLVVLAAVFAGVWLLTRPAPVEGEKALHIDVIVDGETVRSLDFRTDALYLREALDEQDLIAGDETSFGLMVTSVNGREAVGAEYWWFTQNGVDLEVGVDGTVIEDGDRITAELMVWLG